MYATQRMLFLRASTARWLVKSTFSSRERCPSVSGAELWCCVLMFRCLYPSVRPLRAASATYSAPSAPPQRRQCRKRPRLCCRHGGLTSTGGLPLRTTPVASGAPRNPRHRRRQRHLLLVPRHERFVRHQQRRHRQRADERLGHAAEARDDGGGSGLRNTRAKGRR